MMRGDIIEKFKGYGIYALMHPFIDRQPVCWLYDVFCPFLSKTGYTSFVRFVFSVLVSH